ncbi:hypothetical protein ACIBBD_15420 [Streptomyces sp. NPDC051315]|uniref:hypothetical protein n=1 Tax=Streptomyces sp. NPDC051315 TaxID=3365650 RepID=UPI0037A139F0
MTSSFFRGRTRRAGAHLSVRWARAALGGAAGVVWLLLPGMTTGTDVPVAITRAVSAAPEENGTSAVDLVLPLALLVAAGVAAGYGYLRRVRRSRGRTTPGGAGISPPAAPPPAGLDERARELLVEADDRLRAARVELGFAEALSGAEAVAPFSRALRDAERELAAAFRLRQRYDEGVPEEEAARRHTLAGIVGRCEEAGRRLDTVAGDFVRLRGLEQGAGGALGVAETRFRELTVRTGAAESLLDRLGARYATTATAPVVGHVEQAKDRLLFATVRLNLARQATDLGRPGDAARHLRAAEGAVAQAAVFVEGVERLAAELREAESMVPAALTGAEADLAAVRGPAGAGGEPLARLLHADAVLAAVRRELTAGQPYDPVGVLRRIVRATTPLVPGRSGVLSAAALLTARAATAAADDFVATHRGAVDATPRTRLAEARRLLATGAPADRPHAETLALEARELAEQDVRVRGNPYAGVAGGAAGASSAVSATAGTSGAVLGGIVPAEDPEGGCPAGFAAPPVRTGSATPPPGP